LITYWYNSKNLTKKTLTSLNVFSDSVFRSDFKLPLAGYLNATVNDSQSNGFYWSSSPLDGDSAYYLYLGISEVRADYESRRANGLSVRCFKDSPEVPDPRTVTFNENG
jgi:uncharacterized protein (TIGR02145 family)